MAFRAGEVTIPWMNIDKQVGRR